MAATSRTMQHLTMVSRGSKYHCRFNMMSVDINQFTTRSESLTCFHTMREQGGEVEIRTRTSRVGERCVQVVRLGTGSDHMKSTDIERKTTTGCHNCGLQQCSWMLGAPSRAGAGLKMRSQLWPTDRACVVCGYRSVNGPMQFECRACGWAMCQRHSQGHEARCDGVEIEGVST